MAKSSKNNEDFSSKLLWIAGGAALSAAAYYFVNKHLKEKEELQRLQYAEQRRLREGSESSE